MIFIETNYYFLILLLLKFIIGMITYFVDYLLAFSF